MSSPLNHGSMITHLRSESDLVPVKENKENSVFPVKEPGGPHSLRQDSHDCPPRLSEGAPSFKDRMPRLPIILIPRSDAAAVIAPSKPRKIAGVEGAPCGLPV